MNGRLSDMVEKEEHSVPHVYGMTTERKWQRYAHSIINGGSKLAAYRLARRNITISNAKPINDGAASIIMVT